MLCLLELRKCKAHPFVGAWRQGGSSGTPLLLLYFPLLLLLLLSAPKHRDVRDMLAESNAHIQHLWVTCMHPCASGSLPEDKGRPPENAKTQWWSPAHMDESGHWLCTHAYAGQQTSARRGACMHIAQAQKTYCCSRRSHRCCYLQGAQHTAQSSAQLTAQQPAEQNEIAARSYASSKTCSLQSFIL